MKIEQQVCTLEQAKRLNDLGVAQICHYWWTWYDDKKPELRHMSDTLFTEGVPAFTVAELGVMLPYNCTITGLSMHDKKTCAYYGGDYGEEKTHKHTTYGETEAEARAAMLIYLLENNLITAEEVNQRLKA